MIVYVYAIFGADGDYRDPLRYPTVAWTTAEAARAAAATYVFDAFIGMGAAEGEADEVLAWEEREQTRDGRYPMFVAPTKHGDEVRVWPIEVMDDPPSQEHPEP